tara:strand:+ start:2178 stop:4829 length:2652 start_codon:yes stop_codon:yes gene_type:complete
MTEPITIYRAQPASTNVIRQKDYVTKSRQFAQDHAVTSALYHEEEFQIVFARVPEEQIVEADNPGEYRYMGEPIKAIPLKIVTTKGAIVSPHSRNRKKDLEEEIYNKIVGMPVDEAMKDLKKAKERLSNDEVMMTILTTFEAGDPSGNHKYLNWLLKRAQQRVHSEKEWGNEPDPGWAKDYAEDLIKQIQTYHEILPFLTGTAKDIGSFKDVHSLGAAITFGQEKREQSKKKKERKITISKQAQEESDIVFEDDNVLIVRPNTMFASCYFGSDMSRTRWCISATKSQNYFDQYTDRGKVFYFILQKGMSQEDPGHALAFVYNHMGRDEEGPFNAEDKEISRKEIIEYLGGEDNYDAYNDIMDQHAEDNPPEGVNIAERIEELSIEVNRSLAEDNVWDGSSGRLIEVEVSAEDNDFSYRIEVFVTHSYDFLISEEAYEALPEGEIELPDEIYDMIVEHVQKETSDQVPIGQEDYGSSIGPDFIVCRKHRAGTDTPKITMTIQGIEQNYPEMGDELENVMQDLNYRVPKMPGIISANYQDIREKIRQELIDDEYYEDHDWYGLGTYKSWFKKSQIDSYLDKMTDIDNSGDLDNNLRRKYRKELGETFLEDLGVDSRDFESIISNDWGRAIVRLKEVMPIFRDMSLNGKTFFDRRLGGMILKRTMRQFSDLVGKQLDLPLDDQDIDSRYNSSNDVNTVERARTILSKSGAFNVLQNNPDAAIGIFTDWREENGFFFSINFSVVDSKEKFDTLRRFAILVSLNKPAFSKLLRDNASYLIDIHAEKGNMMKEGYDADAALAEQIYNKIIDSKEFAKTLEEVIYDKMVAAYRSKSLNTSGETFQRDIKKSHQKMKKNLITKGGNKHTEDGMLKPDTKRAKSAPPGAGGV